jgi:hypothetical protein
MQVAEPLHQVAACARVYRSASSLRAGGRPRSAAGELVALEQLIFWVAPPPQPRGSTGSNHALAAMRAEQRADALRARRAVRSQAARIWSGRGRTRRTGRPTQPRRADLPRALPAAAAATSEEASAERGQQDGPAGHAAPRRLEARPTRSSAAGAAHQRAAMLRELGAHGQRAPWPWSRPAHRAPPRSAPAAGPACTRAIQQLLADAASPQLAQRLDARFHATGSAGCPACARPRPCGAARRARRTAPAAGPRAWRCGRARQCAALDCG